MLHAAYVYVNYAPQSMLCYAMLEALEYFRFDPPIRNTYLGRCLVLTYLTL